MPGAWLPGAQGASGVPDTPVSSRVPGAPGSFQAPGSSSSPGARASWSNLTAGEDRSVTTREPLLRQMVEEKRFPASNYRKSRHVKLCHPVLRQRIPDTGGDAETLADTSVWRCLAVFSQVTLALVPAARCPRSPVRGPLVPAAGYAGSQVRWGSSAWPPGAPGRRSRWLWSGRPPGALGCGSGGSSACLPGSPGRRSLRLLGQATSEAGSIPSRRAPVSRRASADQARLAGLNRRSPASTRSSRRARRWRCVPDRQPSGASTVR